MPADRAMDNLQIIVGQHLADRFPGSNVIIQKFCQQLGNCIMTVTTTDKKLIGTFVVHFNPNGIVTAIDPPLQPICDCGG